jgi:eukaryotic-like serine/threonine-protein kinase
MDIPDLEGKKSKTQYTAFSFHAKGGMGEIYKATDREQNCEVAVKLIPIVDPSEMKLLEQEMKVTSSLVGPNIVTSHHHGQITISGRQYLYLVQDFYGNGNLRKLINPGIGLDACYKIFFELLDGLSVAHKSVVHRDLKPENILIDDNGVAVITDFGLAKYVDEKTRSRSFKGAGTIPYMAPECWLLQENTPSMDIYSLGIMFYELLVGSLPFNGKTEAAWRDFHVYQPLPDISSFRQELPTRLKQTIVRMTQKRIPDRYGSAEEVRTSLAEAQTQDIASRREAERLASIGHSTLAAIQQRQMKEQQEKDRITEYCKALNFNISEYFEKLKQLVNSVNQGLDPKNRIMVVEKPYNGRLTERTLSLTFNGRSIYVTFPDWDYLDQANQRYRKMSMEMQRNQHGRILRSPGSTIFEQRKIVFFGKVTCNTQNPAYRECFGYNLVLVRNDGDPYGRWFAAFFSDSGFSRSHRSNFALNFELFVSNFEKTTMTSEIVVDYHELGDTDLSRVIEELVRS